MSFDFGEIAFNFLLGSAPIIHGLITLPVMELVGRVKFWTSWEDKWYGSQPLRGSSVELRELNKNQELTAIS